MLRSFLQVRGHVAAATPFRLAPAAALQARMLSTEVKAKIEESIKGNDVCLFMKGTQQQPMCGFSRAAVQVLQLQGVSRVKTVNVLEDQEVRDGIKEYSEWPTIPQLYVKGQFVGGADILIEMYRSGELESLLVKEGIVAPVPPVGVDKQE